MSTAALDGRRIELRGTVQGVGMRPWIYRLAHERGIAGRVWNHADGVTIEAFGTPDSLEAFVADLGATQPAAARTDAIACTAIAAEAIDRFEIIESRAAAERRVSIPPDLATCPDCVAEIFDASNRRYRYAFTNCTNCGPRFTITHDVPYDRATTTMAPFAMCPRCQREYDDPADRRFHAQPNACPACGPKLTVLAPSGERIDLPEGSDAITYAARAIANGRIVAVKGLGGFHLACDATSSAAVSRLRSRKLRDEKPLAVMVRDIAAARALAAIGQEERACLASEVAPRNPLVGVMLAYTPLHHLLSAEAGVPLVMTSANISEEPIVYRNDEAVQRLGAIADVLLVHDRQIMTRCDDSVVTRMAGGLTILRRPLATPVEEPVLACGALLKNTFCVADGREAWLGPHIGDLENLVTFTAYQDAIARLERFLGVCPAIVAHDLHPDYLSTRYAQERGLPTVAVQHHHAHIASAMAEHGLDGPVLGIAFDGTGYGTDGTAWGGEFLISDARSAHRVATFRAFGLPGGDAAIRHPWRTALSLVLDAMGDDAPLDRLPLFRPLAHTDIQVVRRMLAAEFNAPAVRGVGRYFDGIGALTLARGHARYEGQVAFELDMAADRREGGAYDFVVDASSPLLEIDFRPVVRGVVHDVIAAVDARLISARFHNTLAAAAAAVARRTAALLPGSGRRAIVLSGGCFQNVQLTERVVSQLAGDHDVYVHRRVPPNDGGIALGQALVASQQGR
jgi:hydrogenase maturation protein HypF